MAKSDYFKLARIEEKAGNISSALLFYLSDFCSHFNTSLETLPSGTVNKIRHIQKALLLSDAELLGMVRSYGFLSDDTCRELLLCSIRGDVSGIYAALQNGGGAYGL